MQLKLDETIIVLLDEIIVPGHGHQNPKHHYPVQLCTSLASRIQLYTCFRHEMIRKRVKLENVKMISVGYFSVALVENIKNKQSNSFTISKT